MGQRRVMVERLPDTDSGQPFERLLPSASYRELVNLQEAVVDFLDRRIDELRRKPAPRTEWAELYNSLMNEKRLEIDTLLAGVTAGLRL